MDWIKKKSRAFNVSGNVDSDDGIQRDIFGRYIFAEVFSVMYAGGDFLGEQIYLHFANIFASFRLLQVRSKHCNFLRDIKDQYVPMLYVLYKRNSMTLSKFYPIILFHPEKLRVLWNHFVMDDISLPKSAYGPYCLLNPIQNGVFISVEISLYMYIGQSDGVMVVS